MRKKSLYLLTLLSFLVLFIMPISSCKTGEGCPNQTQYSAPEDLGSKKANKRGKSSLFGKKAKKKRKK